MAAQFDLFQNKGAQYQFRLKAANGEVVAVSESYTTKSAARNGVEAVRNAAAAAVIVELDD